MPAESFRSGRRTRTLPHGDDPVEQYRSVAQHPTEGELRQGDDSAGYAYDAVVWHLAHGAVSAAVQRRVWTPGPWVAVDPVATADAAEGPTDR